MTEAYVIDKSKRILCPICKCNGGGEQPMVFHHAMIFHSPWSTDRSVGIWACDESWKCLRCRNMQFFGFPITKEQFLATEEVWHGHIECQSETDKEKERALIKERLTRLGYLDVERRL